MATVLALDVGATNLRLAVASDMTLGEVAVHRTADLAAGPGDLLSGIAEAAHAAVERTGRATRPAAVGVGIAAFVGRDGTLLEATPYGVPGGDALGRSLEEALGIPVVVDNDANMAALGELTCGAGRGVPDLVVMTLGTNIGGALVADGRIVRGRHGIAGEIGMILVAADRGAGGTNSEADAGPLGRGATSAPAGYAYLEDLSGGGSLRRRTAGRGSNGGADVLARAAAGDAVARRAVDEAIEAWAVLVADLSVVVDPGLVILSGGLVTEADLYLEPLRRRVGELTRFAPEIRIGELGASAGLVGAAVAARRVAGTPEARHPDDALTG